MKSTKKATNRLRIHVIKKERKPGCGGWQHSFATTPLEMIFVDKPASKPTIMVICPAHVAVQRGPPRWVPTWLPTWPMVVLTFVGGSSRLAIVRWFVDNLVVGPFERHRGRATTRALLDAAFDRTHAARTVGTVRGLTLDKLDNQGWSLAMSDHCCPHGAGSIVLVNLANRQGEPTERTTWHPRNRPLTGRNWTKPRERG